MRWICIQRGAREHYAIPRALHKAERLEWLFTEFYASNGWVTFCRRFPINAFKRLAGRRHSQLDERKVVAWNFGALIRSLHRKYKSRYQYYEAENRWLSLRCLKKLLAYEELLRGNVLLFSYSGTALELFKWAKKAEIRTILGVIDPGRVEHEMVREEAARWLGWEATPEEPTQSYYQRREEECKLADVIIVNSRWSFEALVRQGVPREKMRIVPLCYEPDSAMAGNIDELNDTRKRERPFTVLYLGQVILRKGIQYLIEAAKRPALTDVIFDVVGPIGISENAIKAAPHNVRFHGLVSRQEVGAWFKNSDIFVLPTISDGFAITQLEAMAHGLPVIATPNCGEVVRDGVDGMIVPIRDAEALTRAIQRFACDNDFYYKCRREALIRSRDFTLQRLQSNLITLEQEMSS